MKRTYNNIPLQSVLYVIPGYVKLIIEDYTEAGLLRTDLLPVGTWEGLAKDSNSIPWKYSAARIRDIDPIAESTLRIKVSTQYEEY